MSAARDTLLSLGGRLAIVRRARGLYFATSATAVGIGVDPVSAIRDLRRRMTRAV